MRRVLTGEYKDKGEYHKFLDKKWRYYPVYVEKIHYVKKLLNRFGKNKKILDVGCGEGVLVNEYKNKGYNISGIDYNYKSQYVKKGDITNIDLKSESVDVVLCLDVIEHLSYEMQGKAIKELYRIVKKDGLVVVSVPNLSHLASRFMFLLFGRLLRTSTIDRHVGDRPIAEYYDLYKTAGFKIVKNKGLFPTFPLVSVATYYYPSYVVWWHKILNACNVVTGWCFLVLTVLKKE